MGYSRTGGIRNDYDNAIFAVYHIPGRKGTAGCDHLSGKVLPCAVIGLLVVFCLKDVPESTNYGLPELIAILFIVALHKWKKSTLLSIGGGTVFYMVLVQTIFG